MENANDHPFKVSIVKDAKFFANSHPYKVTIEGGGGTEGKVVDELPEEGETGYIYLVLKEETEEGNIYDEYMWVLQQDDTYGWEHIGATNEVSIILYNETGQNTDGAMTQKAVTDALNNAGGIKTLTIADYNYDYENTGSNNVVALWLLDEGLYRAEDGVNVSPTSGIVNMTSPLGWKDFGNTFLVGPTYTGSFGGKEIIAFHNKGTGKNRLFTTVTKVYISSNDLPTGNVTTWSSALEHNNIADDLTTVADGYVLSARQGKVLDDKIGDIETILETLTTGTGV